MLLPFGLVGITAALSIKEHLDAALAWLVAASALALLYAVAWISRGQIRAPTGEFGCYACVGKGQSGQ